MKRRIIIPVPDNCEECHFNELGDCMAFLDRKGHARMILKSNEPHTYCRKAEEMLRR